MTHPTTIQSAAFVALFDYLNQALFGGELSSRVILTFSRKSRTFGFFAAERWTEGAEGEPAHEIAINPSYLSSRPFEEVAATLAHEMAHLWQSQEGTPGKRGYHNAEWGEKMDAIGLTPSSTGAPGGRRTGVRVSHYIVPDGAFARAWAARPPECDTLPFVCVEGAEETRRKTASVRSKTKYSCDCGINVWAKPGLETLQCAECLEPFKEEEK